MLVYGSGTDTAPARQLQQFLERTRPFFGCRRAVETQAANPGDHGGSFKQLNVGFVLARNMRILEEDHATTTTIKDFLCNFGIAAERTASSSVRPSIPSDLLSEATKSAHQRQKLW